LFGVRFHIVMARVVGWVYVLLRTRRALQKAAKRGPVADVDVLPLDGPEAFVVGIFAPRIFVTRGLLAKRHRRHLKAVLAHERAHVSRCDSRWRLAAQLAFAFHLPIVARRLDALLSEAHEMAADEEAARTVGSRSRVAEALVHLARSGAGAPRLAQAFAGSDIEQRVVALLDARRTAHEPTTATLLSFAVLGLTAIGLTAEGVHHGLEVVMGLFTG
jgi:Zn-dependent protease with chaperone function